MESRSRRVGGAVAVAMLVTGCAYLTPQNEDATGPLDSGSQDSTPQSVVVTESSTSEEASSASDTEIAETTVAPTTSTSTTTIPAPLGVDELILKSDGIGDAAFGTEPESVMSYVSSILGSPTDDTDWVSPEQFSCPGTAIRRVQWGVLALMFGDESASASGRAHFMSYTYGVVDKFGEEPRGLRTSDGVTVTDLVSSLLERIDARLDEGDEALDIPPSFFYEREPFPISGLLSGTADDDVVLVISSGSGCLG